MTAPKPEKLRPETRYLQRRAITKLGRLDPIDQAQNVGINLLLDVIERILATGKLPPKALMAKLAASMDTKWRRGDRHILMMEAVAQAIGDDYPLTRPSRRAQKSRAKPSAFTIAEKNLRERGIGTSASEIAHLYDTQWGKRRVAEIQAAWTRYNARKNQP